MAFLNSIRIIVATFLARFSAAVHDNGRICHTLLSCVRSSSHVELLSQVLPIARLLSTSLIPSISTHRLSLVVLLSLVESSHLGISSDFYLRIVDDEVVVVVIRDNVCYYFGLLSLVCPLLLLRLLVRPCLLLLLLSIPVRSTNPIRFLGLACSLPIRPLENHF